MVRHLTLILLGVLSFLPFAVAAGAGEVQRYPSDYQPPVDAPVVDPFRPPAHIGGAGNRGLEYSTAPGSEVRAAKSGQVTFAGPVADSLHVTVAHLDGLRTSYSHLADAAVVEGQFVVQGQLLGTTGQSFHFGARDGDAYVDPALLFGAGARRARLVSGRPPAASGRPAALTGSPGWLRPQPFRDPEPNSWQGPMRRLIDLAVHSRLALG